MNTEEWFINENDLPQPLYKDELPKLIQETREGSKEARDKLIIHNIRLVLYEVSNKFQKVDYNKKDLVSIGIIGLVKAIKTYDTSKGFEFSSYATRCIDNEILMFLRKLKKDQKVDSIDRVISRDNDGNELKLGDGLIDDSDLVEDYEKSETHEIIRELVKKLPERDKEIVKLSFGFYNNKVYTQREIADKLQLSQPFVCKLINRIVQKLGKQLETVGVVELHTQAKTKVKEKGRKPKENKLQQTSLSLEELTSITPAQEIETIEATKKALLLYKENINSSIDSIIKVGIDHEGQGSVLALKPNNKK